MQQFQYKTQQERCTDSGDRAFMVKVFIYFHLSCLALNTFLTCFSFQLCTTEIKTIPKQPNFKAFITPDQSLHTETCNNLHSSYFEVIYQYRYRIYLIIFRKIFNPCFKGLEIGLDFLKAQIKKGF